MCNTFVTAVALVSGASGPSDPVIQRKMAVNWSNWIRQFHRWVSIVLTVTIIVNFAAWTKGPPPAWITYSPLPPLFLLLFSGLYLFALPYARKWRRRQQVGAAAAD